MHIFNKYSLPNFNEVSSIDSKFVAINKFYKDLVKLNSFKSQSDNTKQKKKEYEQVFKNKNEDWKKSMTMKIFKNLKTMQAK